MIIHSLNAAGNTKEETSFRTLQIKSDIKITFLSSFRFLINNKELSAKFLANSALLLLMDHFISIAWKWKGNNSVWTQNDHFFDMNF